MPVEVNNSNIPHNVPDLFSGPDLPQISTASTSTSPPQVSYDCGETKSASLDSNANEVIKPKSRFFTDSNGKILGVSQEVGHASARFLARNQHKQGTVGKERYIPKIKSGKELYEDIEAGPNIDKIYAAKIEIQTDEKGASGVPFIQCFENYGFPQMMLDNISKMYKKPFPIQQAIMSIFKNKPNDIVAHSQTGSGKSAAFLLPIIYQIHDLKSKKLLMSNEKFPYALVLLPTRELAIKMHELSLAFSKGTLVTSALCIGSYSNKKEIVQKGCDILFCTIGKLIGYVQESFIKIERVMYLVLDEADKMIRETEDCHAHIKFLKENIHENHRTLMFSATFDDQAKHNAQEFLNENFYIAKVGQVNIPNDYIQHIFYEVPHHKKINKLIEVLMEDAIPISNDEKINYKVPKTIVFVNKKKRSDKVAIALCLEGGIKAWSINGDRTQNQREEALDAFQNDPDSNVLVSTEVAARGLNFKQLDLVINYDLPDIFEKFTHRVGRTGRKGNFGQAISFFDSQLDRSLAPELFYMLKKNNQDAPEFLARIVEEQKLSSDSLHER